MRSWLSAAIELAYPASSIGVRADEAWANDDDDDDDDDEDEEEDDDDEDKAPEESENNEGEDWDDDDGEDNDGRARCDEEPTVRARGDDDDDSDDESDSGELRNSSCPALELCMPLPEERLLNRCLTSFPDPERKPTKKQNQNKCC
jgi:hypothetical protein